MALAARHFDTSRPVITPGQRFTVDRTGVIGTVRATDAISLAHPGRRNGSVTLKVVVDDRKLTGKEETVTIHLRRR